MKLKEFGSGGGRVPRTPLRSATGFIMVVYEKIFEFYIGHKILAELKDLNNLTEVNKTKAS